MASDDLQAERGVNEEYLRRLNQWYTGLDKIAQGMAVPQNAIWSGNIPRSKPADTVIRPIIGRVALGSEDEYLGSGFYIGPWHQEFDDVQVVNWAAPVAGLYFQGRATKIDYPDPSSYVGRRTFESVEMDLTKLAEELETGVTSATAFPAKGGQLSIPPLPGPEDSAVPTPISEPVASTPISESSERGAGVFPVAGAKPEESESAREDFMIGLCNEALVREALDRPRADHLSSVLTTLQPDQYRLVSWPADRHLVVQGHPGTGKTIVATHRAAFLSHLDKEDRLERIGLVGPTDEWAEHVRHVLGELGGSGITVISLERMVRQFADGLTHALHHDDERWFHVSWDTARIGKRAVAGLRGDLPKIQSRQIRYVLDQLVQLTPLHSKLVKDSTTSGWLLSGKSADEALNKRTFLLLIASIGRALKIGPPVPFFDHVVIDEAQDIRGAEWSLIDSIRRPGSHLSLFGDLNQRRTNHTFSSWQELVNQLEISEDPDYSPETLEQGYRSTRQILDYASHLLESIDRHPKALADGPVPSVEKVKKEAVPAAALREVIRLCGRYPAGKVSVISVDPVDLRREFLKAGWRKTAVRFVLTNESGHEVFMCKPVMARGLEFDGVVVVEPGDFPENLGKQGRLYTSLTRANKELTVLHSNPLPKALKGKGDLKKVYTHNLTLRKKHYTTTLGVGTTLPENG